MQNHNQPEEESETAAFRCEEPAVITSTETLITENVSDDEDGVNICLQKVFGHTSLRENQRHVMRAVSS